ncbi:hypothetical protein J3R30DRAFT_3707768 [Lentinula aciculospora]|uniref:Uncharacterized protein n=1 Tax=Lentinula aciculospora TaxID=153920 RepID=A0A9W9A3Q5_9AGAR|nr:hypothetical protein J3R30DRAFT_3707768 [Lentinula aciculospora]
MSSAIFHVHSDAEALIQRDEKIYVRSPISEEEEEDYAADDEGGMELESSFDTSFNYGESCYDAKLISTPSRSFDRGRLDRQSSTIRMRMLNYRSEFEEDDSDEETFEGHDCPPNCYVCHISAFIYKVKHPELYADEDSDDNEDESEDWTTFTQLTHCVPECISCARERLRAEGYKFPIYQHNQSDHTDDGDKAIVPEQASKPTKQGIKQQEADLEGVRGIVFVPPPPPGSHRQADLTTRSVHGLDAPFPRVFFPPPKPADLNV